jgi:hypothetical protein
VAFANSCDAKVQGELQRGVAMLHSFWFNAGEKAFRQVLADDPGCAIATFGIAALLMNNPLAGQGASPQAAETARAAIAEGRRIGARTERERDYIEAVAAYYADFANRPERARQVSRAAAFEALAAKYPQDDEAQIFAALYVAGTQTQSDQTYAAYLKAADKLEKLFVKYPDHPGVAHYLIHSYDAPPIAAKGLSAARRYSLSRLMRRTRCICRRTSSRGWVPGRTRWPATAARRTSPRRTATATKPSMPLTTWSTPTCSSAATRKHAR